MANNCPFCRVNECAPPGMDGGHNCSWSHFDYEGCAVYKIAAAKAAGGGMEDQLRAAGIIPPHAIVVGGRGRSLASRKKWWQVWE